MKSNKFLISLLVVLVILLSVVCISYSYFTAKVTENNKTETDIKVSNLELQFNGVTEITADGILLGESFTKTFNVVNDTNNELTYNIYMENITNTIGKDLVYSLKDDYKEIVTEKSMPSTADKKYLLKKLTISGNTTVNYTMTVTLLNKEDEDQSNIMGKSFKGTLGIDTLQVPTVVTVLKASNEAMPSTTLNFMNISSDTNGKGLYLLSTTKDDEYPIYFYRGAVTNNNLKIENLCFKIIRTTSTGGIKILYNGTVSENGACDTYSSIGSAQFGTKYYKNGTSNSPVKSAVDTWYFNNLVKYQSYFEDTQFCEDSLSYYGTFYTNTVPSVTCSTENAYTVSDEIGNGKLDYPVALMTIEEYKLIGGNANNNTSYFGYSGVGYWVLGYDTEGNKYYISSDGDRGQTVNLGYMYPSYAIRPVVSLNRNVELGGTGTSDDPYVIIE